MPFKKLELELFISTDSDPEPEANKVIGALRLRDQAEVDAANALIALVDRTDVEPGDGEIDAKGVLKIPTFKIFGHQFTIKADAKATLRLVD